MSRLAALVLPLLAGCALFARTELQPDAHTAVVRAGDWGKVYRGGYVAIVNVNGQQPDWATPRQIKVAPGEQFGVFQVVLCETQHAGCRPLALAQLKLRLAPGAIYDVLAQEKVNGSNEFWVWAQDAKTKTLAGGERPPGG